MTSAIASQTLIDVAAEAMLNSDDGMEAIQDQRSIQCRQTTLEKWFSQKKDVFMHWFLGFGRTLLLCVVFSLSYCLAGGLVGGVIGLIGWGDGAFITGASYGAGVIGVGLLPGIVMVIGSCFQDSYPNETAGDVLLNLQFTLLLCIVFALIGGIAAGFLGGIVGIIVWGWNGLSSGALIGAGIGAAFATIFMSWMLARKN